MMKQRELNYLKECALKEQNTKIPKGMSILDRLESERLKKD
jgi:hypothetical protein